MSRSTRVVVYTKSGCSLCDTAIRAIEGLVADRGLTIAPFDIESGPEEVRLHQRDRIPVVEFRGVEVAWGRVDPAEVERGLDEVLGRDAGGGRFSAL